MTEGITHKNLMFVMDNIAAYIVRLDMMECANDHGRLALIAVLNDEMKEQVIHKDTVTCAVLYKNDPEDTEEKAKQLFTGIVTHLYIEASGDVYYLNVEALSATYLMDFSPWSRSFQDMSFTSHTLIEHILSGHEGSRSILKIPDERLTGIAVQYEESTWTFLKRFCAGYGAVIFPKCNESEIYLHVGLKEELEEVEWDELPYTVYDDKENTHYFKANSLDQHSLQSDICYQIYSYDIVALGSKVKFHGQEMYVGSVIRRLNGELLINEYTLYFKEGLTVSKYYNPLLIGISIFGKVLAVTRDRVQVLLETDMGVTPAEPYWFPYSSPTASADGTGWYSMPRKGDLVRIFFPGDEEAEGYAISYAEGDANAGNPKIKVIRTPEGKNIEFLESGVRLSVEEGKSVIQLMDDGSITLSCEQDLILSAGNSVGIGSGGTTSITSGGTIELKNKAGSSILMEGGTTTLTGDKIYLSDL